MTTGELHIGQEVDSYRVQSFLAQGGMAAVYVAQDVSLKREVILKVMLPALAQNQEFVARFQREAQITARLNHPNIVQVYSIGLTEDSRSYLAMQYVRGGTLQARLEMLSGRGELFTTTAALSIMCQMAEALHAAHQAGIVHRDLKPSNILLHPNGVPVLSDLGIASVESMTRLTQTGRVLGTPYYMSPEQATGKPLDGRSDIYSLGVVLYELLAGSVPFQGESPMAVLHDHIYSPPLPLARLRPDLSEVTCGVVARCMAKNPDVRYQNAAELVQALELALAAEKAARPPTMDTPIPVGQTVFQQLTRRSELLRRVSPPDGTPVMPKTRRPVPVWVWATGAVLAVLLAFIALARPFGGDGNPGGAGDAFSGLEKPATEKLPAAVVAMVTEAPDTATPLPTAQPTAFPTFTPMPSPTSVPLQNKIVFQSNRDGDYDIYIMDADGSNQINLTNNDAEDNYPAVSPDGSRIVFESDRDGNWEVYAIGTDGSGLQRLTNAPASRDRLPTWSPDGQQIAYISDADGDYELFIMNADGSKPRQITYNEQREGHVSWSVENQLVFNAGPEDSDYWEIYTLNLADMALQQLTDNSISDWAPEWSPDGRRIIYLSLVGNDPAIFMINADGSDGRLFYNTPDYDWGADWTADGQQIVFTRDEGNVGVIYMVNVDGSNLRKITDRGSYPSWVR